MMVTIKQTLAYLTLILFILGDCMYRYGVYFKRLQSSHGVLIALFSRESEAVEMCDGFNNPDKNEFQQFVVKQVSSDKHTQFFDFIFTGDQTYNLKGIAIRARKLGTIHRGPEIVHKNVLNHPQYDRYFVQVVARSYKEAAEMAMEAFASDMFTQI